MNKFNSDGKPEVYIFDCDGTLALCDGIRSPYDESKVHLDKPNWPVIKTVHALQKVGYGIIITSGRHEATRAATSEWLRKYHVFYDAMFMRPDSSSKREEKDADLKERIYREFIEPFFSVVAIFDDRVRVVNRWRSMNLTCYQVAPGDFDLARPRARIKELLDKIDPHGDVNTMVEAAKELKKEVYKLVNE